MDGLASADTLLFEAFRLDRGGLFRLDQAGIAAPVVLGSRALDLLHLLVERKGELVSKDQIMAAVWPGTAVDEGNLTVQISALRRILDQNREQGSCIQTVPGRGYRFVAPVTRVEPAAPPGSSIPPSGNGSPAPIAERGQLREPAAASRLGDKHPAAASPRHYRLRAGIIGTVILALGLVAAMAAWNWRSLWPGDAHPVPRLSIVVLPFANLSDDREQQYFADAVTEDLTTDLSRIADSFVISRNTAFTYKDKPVSAKQIGRELGVRYVLEGSVQRSSSQIRVNAQLIDAGTDAHLWAERLERDTSNLFALQNEITSRIASTLNLELIAAEAARPTDNPDALDYILQGRAARLRLSSREVFAEEINLFEHALVLDPLSVEAQSLLASSLVSRVIDGMTDSATADLARADGLVGRVLAASPRHGQAHFIKGQLLRAQHRCAEAILEYETVLAIDRNATDVLHALGRCKLVIGAIEEVIPLEEQAIRLSPRDPIIGFMYARIGLVHLLQSRTEEAILWLEKAISSEPEFSTSHAWLASAYSLNGETERAAAELAKARSLRGEGSYSSIARLRTGGLGAAPKIRALVEATYFTGLRKAGVPEE